jgi:hypothetical protein
MGQCRLPLSALLAQQQRFLSAIFHLRSRIEYTTPRPRAHNKHPEKANKQWLSPRGLSLNSTTSSSLRMHVQRLFKQTHETELSLLFFTLQTFTHLFPFSSMSLPTNHHDMGRIPRFAIFVRYFRPLIPAFPSCLTPVVLS